MTTIIGITNGSDLLIAGDRLASDGDVNVLSRTPKVRRVGDDVVAGFAGSWRGGELGLDALDVLDTDDPSCSIVTMVEAINTAWEAASFKNEDTVFLIGYGGQWFEVQSDLGYVAIDSEYHAIGSGSSFALGALYANGSVRQAFEAASRWSNSSSSYDMVEIRF